MISMKIPNEVFYENSERKLSPDELLLFSFLVKNRNYNDCIYVSVELLQDLFEFQKGKVSRNTKYIYEILNSLLQKKYISVLGSVEIIKDKTNLVQINTENTNGYIYVTSDVFDGILDQIDVNEAKLRYYLFMYIHCYGKTGRLVNYNKLSEICSYFQSKKKYSISTIQKVINDLDGKYIFRFSGDYIEGDVTQEPNIYYTHLDENKINEYYEHIEKKKIKKKQKQNNISNSSLVIPTVSWGEISVDELSGYIKGSNWQKKENSNGEFMMLDSFDYEAYRVSKLYRLNLKFVRSCEKGIRKMKEQPDKYAYDWDKLEREYLDERQKQGLEI